MAKVIKGVNDFETLYPDMAKEWHPTANGKLLPSEVASRSNKKYFWLCSNVNNVCLLLKYLKMLVMI